MNVSLYKIFKLVAFKQNYILFPISSSKNIFSCTMIKWSPDYSKLMEHYYTKCLISIFILLTFCVVLSVCFLEVCKCEVTSVMPYSEMA